MRSFVFALLWLLNVGAQAAQFKAAAFEAPKLSERSAMTQGLWWDRTRAGEGVELYQFGRDLFIVWYTYRPDRTPVWYTAQGTLDPLGNVAAPLLIQRMEGGVRRSESIGSVKIELLAPERMHFAWTLGNTAGSLELAPFRASAVVSEQDHSGLWWQPELSGYGIGVTETGDYQALTVYAYDAVGNPTWLFGSRNDATSDLELISFRGSCPSCTYEPAKINTRVNAQLVFVNATQANITIPNGAPLAVSYLGPKSIQSFSATGLQRKADQSLARISDAQALQNHLARAFTASINEGQFAPCIAFAPSAEGREAFSATNIQEQSVDEAALLRTDGEMVYALDSEAGKLRIARYQNASLQTFDSVALKQQNPLSNLSSTGFFLTDNQIVVTSTSFPSAPPCGVVSRFAASAAWSNGETAIEILDRSDRSRPSRQFSATISGYLLSSRRIGNQLYLVTRDFRPAPPGLRPVKDASDLSFNRAELGKQPLTALLPTIKIGDSTQPLVLPEQVYVPPTGYEFANADYITVTRIPLQAPEQFQSLALLGRALDVYVSENNLYLISSRQAAYSLDTPELSLVQGAYGVDIHQISLANHSLRFVGTGTAEGAVPGLGSGRGPWRYSELDGRLRIVTASTGDWGTNRNRLTIMEPSSARPGFLRTVSILPNKARTATIGKPNEDLYATRFIGERLYAVTFRRVDPLYVIDLSNPSDPKITGELEIPGFSDYLHPISPTVLVGIGLAASDAGGGIGDGQFAWFKGLQLSLFDVSNPSAPTELQRIELGQRGSYSELFNQHQAFSILSDGGEQEFAIPAVIHQSPVPLPAPSSYAPFKESGLMRYRITGAGANTRMQALPSLITRRATPQIPYAEGQFGARSILFQQAVVYFESGKFYLMQRDGSNQSGPL